MLCKLLPCFGIRLETVLIAFAHYHG
jgi:hypothetical protein